MECGLTDQVELQVRDGQLVIRSLHHPRSGWEEAYAEMHKSGEDALLDADSHNASDWDRQAWRW
ncbi:MAG TPA: AbrB/MazE/SpoVT family DNA-binding domain-containing protein [Gammaproteobacteria bacterium]|nr:AbrB/MazE/SpoVT family DNA-binding domain-containing protein [Gammaproteobacteria bacterium]